MTASNWCDIDPICSLELGHTTHCKDMPYPGGYVVKDSGKREEFDSGMVRDTTDGKTDYTRCLEGPMLERWAVHLAKGAIKYPDVAPGKANWTLGRGTEEWLRFRQSALRHMVQWLNGDTDEDHAGAIFFNVNGAENVKENTNE